MGIEDLMLANRSIEASNLFMKQTQVKEVGPESSVPQVLSNIISLFLYGDVFDPR